MDFIKFCDINLFVRKRTGEVKIGERVQVGEQNWQNELKASSARFVILGIAEDIGVKANYGRGGAHTAFKPTLESFLSQQSNHFFDGKEVFVLGEVMVDDLMEKSQHLNTKTRDEISQLRELVSLIDKRVIEIVTYIVSIGKIPLIVGGGHNNSYGNIVGSFKALNERINVINCDPHLDFRPLEGRHSGNGFSYAFEEGALNRYSVFSMHEQYNNSGALDKFKNTPQQLYYNTYESIFVREDLDFKTALKQSIGFVKENKCGVEIDLDSITNVPSSAKTSSGISPVQARQYVYQCASNLDVLYFHVAEGAPVLSHIKADNKTGKLIAYLLSDFIKGVLSRNV